MNSGSFFGVLCGRGITTVRFSLSLLVYTLADRISDTLLVESGPEWVYGSYDSYFHLPALDCVPPESAYDRRATVSVGKQGWEDAQHLSMTRGQFVALLSRYFSEDG